MFGPAASVLIGAGVAYATITGNDRVHDTRLDGHDKEIREVKDRQNKQDDTAQHTLEAVMRIESKVGHIEGKLEGK